MLSPMPPQASSPSSGAPERSNKRLLTAAVVGAVIIAVGLAFWYLDPQSMRNRALITIDATIADADKTFAVDRDYDAAIKIAEDALVEARVLGPEVECRAKFELAHKLLRYRSEEAMEIYGEVYNNPAYDAECKANAIAYAMMQVASFTGLEPDLSFEVVKTKVFAPGYLDVLPPGTKLDTTTQVRRAAVIAFEKSYELKPSHVAAIGAARYMAAYLRGDYRKGKRNAEYLKKMKEWHDRAMPLLEEDRRRSLERKEFSNLIAYTLGSRINPLIVLARTGHVTPQELYDAAEDVFEYTEIFRETAGYFPAVQQGVTAHKYAAAMALLEKRPLTETQKQKIRDILEYLYRLPDEDLEYRMGIRALADRMNDSLREPTIYIANNVDPRLKDVLINKIGGWKEEHFE